MLGNFRPADGSGPTPPDALKRRDHLPGIHSLLSRDERFELYLHSNGDLYLFGYTDAEQNQIARLGTAGVRDEAFLMMDEDGELALYDRRVSGNVRFWQCGTAGNPGAMALLDNTGRFSVCLDTGLVLWQLCDPVGLGARNRDYIIPDRTLAQVGNAGSVVLNGTPNGTVVNGSGQVSLIRGPDFNRCLGPGEEIEIHNPGTLEAVTVSYDSGGKARTISHSAESIPPGTPFRFEFKNGSSRLTMQ